MTPAQERKLDQILEEHFEAKKSREETKRDIMEMKILLVGNKELEQKGLVHDIKTLKDYKEKDETLKAKIAGAVLVITTLFSAFWAWVWSKFTGGH